MAISPDVCKKRPEFGTRTPAEFLDAIADGALRNLKPPQIYGELLRRRAAGEFPGLTVPSTKTIKRVLDQQKSKDDKTWSLKDATTDEATLVPALLLELSQREGRRIHLSQDQARVITNIRLAAPDLKLEWVLEFAQKYLARNDTHDLDEALAFAPWRDAEFIRYVRFLQQSQPARLPRAGPPIDGALATVLRIQAHVRGDARTDLWEMWKRYGAPVLTGEDSNNG
jgi:hypothetical protein